ncbi:hypothetical protein HPB52_024832 [Rhipicephalus sanguineus]|uniref:Endonuclease/exonuclease/phosphatase domain-containing protein n=1 Tax=Rhipicephalus sanguineus TaxID=34632 RepID=A0A9D4SME2_RHISA|nr:hypothetical protein HPB52_024832 [Rhipicephalus sanguineus]
MEKKLVDWVQCPSCERWLERSDTPFETTQEAEADSSFLCRICETMRIMREESQLQYKQESERWQLALDILAARLEAHIVNSKNEREDGRSNAASGLRSDLRKERAEDSQTSIPSSRKKTANSPPERPAGLPGAFVYGDGNARRLKRAVLQASAWHRGVHCRTKKDATLVETMEAIETATDVWDSTEAIVVLHAGLSDIQDDTSPHDSTERFKSQITSWKARAKGHFFVVYGVPEVGPKDDTMRIKQPQAQGMECETNNLHDDCPGTGNPTNGQSTEVAEALLAQDVKKKTARRRRSRKKSKDIHVGFLNLHGARTASKWEELYQMMGESRKGGGIGFLWKTRSAWKKLDSPCVEHMWVEGYLQGLPVLVGVVYFAVSAGADAGNSSMAQCIREDVARWASHREVLIMGDFNGHLQALDGFQDTNGELLLTLARTLALEVLNLRPECEGQYTWSARNSRSCIDYVLATPALARRLTHMNIDENGEFSIGSDHNRIKLSFSRSSWRTIAKEHRNPAERHLPQSEYAAVAEAFEQNFQPTEPPTYDQFVLELRRIMKKHEIRVNSAAAYGAKAGGTKRYKGPLLQDERRIGLHRAAVRHHPERSA